MMVRLADLGSTHHHDGKDDFGPNGKLVSGV